ncbi:hypothetical protein [Pseudomonas savastanoi]|nr:hypothetical protein [Pseudomonas savastanoi]
MPPLEKFEGMLPVDAVKSWLKRNWIWTAMAVVIAALGGKLFYTYAQMLPYVSNEHAAWSSFGSLMAGFFTLTGTVATIATLLFLARQNKEMQKVTQTQMDTLTFERYINHRKLFSEHLQELVALHKNTFTFRDPSSLYTAFFPQNSPHHCSFTTAPTFDENGDGTNQLGEMLGKLRRLKAYLHQSQFDEDEPQELVLLLITLAYYIFMIEPTKLAQEGDIRFLTNEYGINIYSLKSFVDPCLSIANMLLRFTDNPLVDVREFNSESRFVREALIKRYHLQKAKHAITIHSEVKGIHVLAFVYFEAQRLREDGAFIFPQTVKLLNAKFQSVEAVKTLADDFVFNDMLNVLLNEVTIKVHEMDTGLEYYNDAARVRDLLHTLISRADNF